MTEQMLSRQPRLARTREIHVAREHEILRVAASLPEEPTAIKTAVDEILRWVQNKTIGDLPPDAWSHRSFEHLSSGRSSTAVRIETADEDIWALRIEDPDKTVPGRIWTTEIAISKQSEAPASFTLRLLVGSAESNLNFEPHVPGVVRQLIDSPGLRAGEHHLIDKPVMIRKNESSMLLIDMLLDPSRKLPIIILSVPSSSRMPEKPLVEAKILAQACAGLAIVVVLPSQFCWQLTERFGKRLSVYEGAARVYLPGFTEDANPFGGHELILPDRLSNPEDAALRLRQIAAIGSVRRLQLGKDVPAFAALRTRWLQQKQLELQTSGASDREQLEAAQIRIALLQKQFDESEKYQSEFSHLHELAEERATTAEIQLRASSFRIQQLLEQIRLIGVVPDAKIELPKDWSVFVDWCENNLAGRVGLSPQARRGLRTPEFQDVSLAARCLLWLANEYRELRMYGGEGSVRERAIESGVKNAHCGEDSFEMQYQGRTHLVDWHIKSGGNTRDPARCLRIYYFWDETTQVTVIADMPAHRRTDAS